MKCVWPGQTASGSSQMCNKPACTHLVSNILSALNRPTSAWASVLQTDKWACQAKLPKTSSDKRAFPLKKTHTQKKHKQL